MKESFPFMYLTRNIIAEEFGSEIANTLTDEQMEKLASILNHKYCLTLNTEDLDYCIKYIKPFIDKMIEVKPKYTLCCPKCEGVDIYTIGTIDYLKLDNEGNLEHKYTTGPTSEEKVYKCNKCGYNSESIDCFIIEHK